MHARFNLNPGAEKWFTYEQYGREIHENNKKNIEKNLKTFENADLALEAEQIISNWFPAIQSNVFLSHSHKDEKLILGLAGWLSKNFNLTSFIDSAVWGHADNLIKIIDDKYCKDKNSYYYNYDERNRSTSHVHTMLSTALMNMIDKCECIIFVNTPSSFKPVDYLKNKGTTESPWIYSEIAMTRILREKSPEEHRSQIAFESTTAAQVKKEFLKIEYPLDTFHLTPLTQDNLKEWYNKYTENNHNERQKHSLDYLYDIKRIK